MTITLKPTAVVLVVALLGVLAGIAIGQIASAGSAPPASAAAAGEVRQLKQIKRKIGTSNAKLGEANERLRAIHENTLSALVDILNNTGEICQATAGTNQCAKRE